MTRIYTYDTTLRDGSQGEGINFSLQDKLLLTRRLDELGIDFIEGGYPLSNPKDFDYFQEVRKLPLKHARIAAFGMTRRKGATAAEDAGMKALIDSQAPIITIVGKTWDLHVRDILNTTLEENLRMIADSVAFCKAAGRDVFYDAEHFFDGFRANSQYALQTLRAAKQAGASVIILCDTNGGSLPDDIARAAEKTWQMLGEGFGIHCHNDCDLAVANTLTAVGFGARQVQGTINGIGERCASAFAHKGGMHTHAVAKNTASYEHIDPEAVGNERRILVSELSGQSTILAKTAKYNITQDRALMAEILNRVQELENEGYEFEAAEASFDLLVKKALGQYRPKFERVAYRVNVEADIRSPAVTEATVKVRVGDGILHTVAEGDGPVNALDGALRKALLATYPRLEEMHLVDYKVRVVNSRAGTAARVRVVIESRDRDDVWGTVGVSENIIEASWLALVDSIEYKLFKDQESKPD